MTRFFALLLVAACGSKERPPQTPSGEVRLTPQQIAERHARIDEVGVARFGTHLDLPGKIAFDELRVAHVFSPVSGRIAKIDAALGQRVSKGASLVELESPDVGGAVADLDKAKADLAAADKELQRQRTLVAGQASSQRELDQAEDAYERARAESVRARQRTVLLRGRGVDAVTQRIVLRTPVSGEVIFRSVNPGTDIAGQSAGGPSPELFTVGSLDPIWALADVPESALAKVRAGASAEVKVVAYADRTFAGTVDWISGSLDPATRMAHLRCTLKNPKHELLPEMYAVVSVATEGHDTLAIPRTAVISAGDQSMVFVQIDTNESGQIELQLRRVVLGEEEHGLAEVRAGLSKGDRIVVEGAAELNQ